MNIKLKDLLPDDVSDETAFHLVKFVYDLARVLGSIYFEKMFHYTNISEHDPFTFDPFSSDKKEKNGHPF